MKFVIDAYQASPNITGTDRLAFSMLREMQTIDNKNEYIVLTNRANDYIGKSITAPNFTNRPISLPRGASWLMIGLPWVLWRERADAFFSFHNLAGPGIRVCYTVGSLLDLIPISRQDLYFDKDSKFRRWVVLWSMKRAAANTDKFMAISEFTKAEAVKYLAIPSSAIDVVYLQADPGFFVPLNKADLDNTRSKYELPQKFVFAMGASEPRKNVSGLIKAHRLLPPTLRQKFPLVIAGARWHGRGLHIGNDPYIKMTGFIDDNDLPAVYHLASLFVFPSTYEGFGMPVLEAMAAGAPVVASNTTSVPEAAGEAGVLVDPKNAQELSNAIGKVLIDDKLAKSLIAAGQMQAKKFSWEAGAQRIIQMLTRRSQS